MPNELVYSAEVTGFDKVDRALKNQASALTQTATSAAKYGTSIKSLPAGTNEATRSIVDLGRVLQDAPFGFIGIANNINPLLESFKSLGAASGGTTGALKTLGSSLIGPNGLLLAFSAFQFVALGGVDVIKKFFQSASEVQKLEAAKKAIEDYKKAVEGIFSAAAKEQTEVLSLITVLNSEVETRGRKLAALEQLKKINPDIFNGLKLEQGAVVGLDGAYKSYLANLQNVIAAKVIQTKLEEKIELLLKAQGVAQTQGVRNLEATFKKINQERAKALEGLGNPQAVKVLNDLATSVDRIKDEKITKLNSEITDLLKQLSEFSTGIKIDPLKNVSKKVEEEVQKLTRGIRSLPLFSNAPKNAPEFPITIPVQPKIELANPPKFLRDFTENVESFLKNAADGIAINFAETLGNAITGDASIGDFFSGIFKVIAAGLKQLGKQVIAASILIKKIKTFLTTNPALAIAAGAALIVVGTVLENALNKQAFAVGTRSAPGGLSLVGDRGPELLNLPRGAQVTPAAQTANLLTGISDRIEVYGVLKGQDIYFSNKSYAKSYGKTA
jgi:predicted translin family RNA/ssDNA-binding protein